MRAKLLKEALPAGIWDEGNVSALKGWTDKSRNRVSIQIKTIKPLDVVIDDDIDLAKLKFILNKYRIAYTEEKL